MEDMLSVDMGKASTAEISRLVYGLVVPRPIAWISTISPDGQANLAPHSFYNAVSCHPPILMFASTRSASRNSDGYKDTLLNVLATGEFVVNFASRDLLAQLVTTAREVGPDTDEFELAGLEKVPGAMVAVPHVAAARAAFECRVHASTEIGDATVVYGEIIHAHVARDVLVDGRPDAVALDPISRLGGALYSTLGGVIEKKRQ